MATKKETRPYYQVRFDAFRRQILWNFYSGKVPYYLVSEYPKSGGSWFSQILSASLEIPFPRNMNVSFLNKETMLLQGHHNYSKRYKNIVYVLRDGRDVMVSAYYFYLRPNTRTAEWGRKRRLKLQKRLGVEDINDITTYLPRFIEYMFEVYPKRIFRFSWADFTEKVMAHDTITVKYEDLLKDTPNTLAGAVKKLTDKDPDMGKIHAICHEYSFENQTKRKAGQEDASSFLRKGIAGDWRNKFTREAGEVFDRYGGNALIAAGYEMDHEWVNTIS